MGSVDSVMGGLWDVFPRGTVFRHGGNLPAWSPGLSSGLRSLCSVSVSCWRLKALAAH